MWEVSERLSHGRYPVRRIFLAFTAVVMAFFLATIPVHPAYAEDAVRDGDNITFQGHTYVPISGSNVSVPKGLPDGTTGYVYTDSTAKKASFLFMVGNITEATSAQYVIYDFTPPDHFSNASPPQKIAITDTSAETASSSTSSCDSATLGGIGWIICPTVRFLAKSMDFIYGIVSNFLEVRTVTADTSSAVYRLWSIVRDLANVAFVIVFLLIVYSQVSGLGISNFGIKKMLPRLIIAAIVLNVSYWICAFAVDASNILGYSIHSLFTSLFDVLNQGKNYSVTVPTWEVIASAALAGAGAVTVAGIAIAANTLGGAIMLLIPVLLMAALAALAALIVLAARQALLMCLIIISPLAILGYVLPNTEKYFGKWRSAMLTLLMLFPIFSVVFSGAQLAGMAIVQTAGGNLIMIILGMAVQVTPIVITPLLLKFSTGLVAQVGKMITQPSKKLVSKSREWSKGSVQARKQKILADQNRFSKYNNRMPTVRTMRALDSRRRYREAKRKVYDARADNRFAATAKGEEIEALNKETGIQKQRIDNRFAASERGQKLELQARHANVQKQEIDNLLAASAGGQRLEARTRRANVRKQEVTNDFERSTVGQTIIHRQHMADIDKQRVSNEFENTPLGRQVDHDKRVVEAEKRRVEHSHQAEWDHAVQTDPGLLNIELGVKESEIKAAAEKAKLEKMHAEIAAQGLDSEHILNLRGVDPHLQTGMLNIAHNIRAKNLEASVATTAKTMADNVTAQHRTTALIEDKITVDGKTIVDYAAGIKGQAGRRAVIARAKSEDGAVLVEDIKNIQSTIDYDLSTDNVRLRQEFESTDVLAEKIAYAKAMAKNGGPGVKAFRSLLKDIGDFTNPKLVTKDDMLYFKELLASEGSIMSAGKDIEFFLTNNTVNDPVTGDPILDSSGKMQYRTFDDLSQDIKTWTNLTPTAFASQNATTQFFALELLHSKNPDAYLAIIDGLRTNPAARGSLKQGVVQHFSIYSPAEYTAAKKAGKTLPDPGTII